MGRTITQARPHPEVDEPWSGLSRFPQSSFRRSRKRCQPFLIVSGFMVSSFSSTRAESALQGCCRLCARPRREAALDWLTPIVGISYRLDVGHRVQ